MIERVLVVDDDQSLREFLTITLGRDGFEVVAAASGPEALKAMAEAPPTSPWSISRCPAWTGSRRSGD